MSNTQMKPVRKITVKAVYGAVDIEKVLAAKDTGLPIMDVYGIATAAKEGESDYGVYCKFIGQFRAVNLETGETFRSATLLLPRFLEEQLMGLLGGGAVAAEFAVRIQAVYDKTSATKYVYVADSLVEAQESDAFKALEARVCERYKALAAPETIAAGKAAGKSKK